MNILILHSLSVSGAVSGERIVFNREAALLRANGHNVRAIEFGPRRISNSLFYRFYYLVSSLFSLKAFFFVRKNIKQFKPGVVHFHGLFPFLTLSSLMAARIDGVKVVLTLHNVGFICCEGGFFRNHGFCDTCLKSSMFNGVLNSCYKNKFASFIKYLINEVSFSYNFLNRNVDSFIAVSDFIKSAYVTKGLDYSKIFVKYNHVAAPNIDSTEVLVKQGITFVGRLTKSKGTDTLLSIMKSIDVRINIIGDGEESAFLKKMSGILGFNNVYFHGVLDNPAAILMIRNSYCTVIPSVCAESFSLVAAESFVNGIPVVAYDVGGLGELVKKSKAGRVSKVGDQVDFISNVEFFINNLEENKNAGAKGVLFASSELLEDYSYSCLMNIYWL